MYGHTGLESEGLFQKDQNLNASPIDKMCLISYNSRGFSQHKEDICRFLVSPFVNGNKLSILCNQENFVLKANSYKIRKALPGYYAIISAHADGGPRSRVCARETLRSAPHRHERKLSGTHFCSHLQKFRKKTKNRPQGPGGGGLNFIFFP